MTRRKWSAKKTAILHIHKHVILLLCTITYVNHHIAKRNLFASIIMLMYIALVQRPHRWMNNITNRRGGSTQQNETIVCYSKTYSSKILVLLRIYNRTRQEREKNLPNESFFFYYTFKNTWKYLSVSRLQYRCLHIVFVILVWEYGHCLFIRSIVL